MLTPVCPLLGESALFHSPPRSAPRAVGRPECIELCSANFRSVLPLSSSTTRRTVWTVNTARKKMGCLETMGSRKPLGNPVISLCCFSSRTQGSKRGKRSSGMTLFFSKIRFLQGGWMSPLYLRQKRSQRTVRRKFLSKMQSLMCAAVRFLPAFQKIQ